MPINWKQIEREEEWIEQAVAEGRMTREQANKEHRELQRDVQAIAAEEAHDAAEESYRRNMGGW